MSMRTSTGLQDSGKADESDHEDIETNLALSELIDLDQNTDWSEVQAISAAEAGVWTARQIETRETVQEGL